MNHRQVGFSLTELLVVVIILGIIAVVVVPSFSSGDSKALDLAAVEVASAIRFARSESIRTNTVYGFGIGIDVPNQRLQVYRIALVAGVETPEYVVLQPIDKTLYDLRFNVPGPLSSVTMSSGGFSYTGLSGKVYTLSFDASGTPKYRVSGKTYLLANAEIMLSQGQGQGIRRVTVAPMTGKVTVSEN